MKCPKCNLVFSDEESFCPKCGSVLEKEEVSEWFSPLDYYD